jgi:hypothetical protein
LTFLILTPLFMDLSQIAAKNKRIRTWEDALSKGFPDVALVKEFSTQLNELKLILSACCKNKIIESVDLDKIADIERKLEQIFEESRLLGRLNKR